MRLPRPWLYAALAALIALAVYLYASYDPASAESIFPRCPFRVVTGYECPGCGSQRALHALLHGDLAAAFGYNPFLLISLPIVAALMLLRWQRRRFPRLYHLLNSRWFILPYLLATIGWWIGRNL